MDAAPASATGFTELPIKAWTGNTLRVTLAALVTTRDLLDRVADAL